jgi:hypothetical protein
MGFSQPIKTKVLIRCNRVCCLCRKHCGTNIEVAHVIAESQGGPNNEYNAIPLCFDCHQEIGAYDPVHPRGNRFTEVELRARQDEVYALVESGFLPAPVRLAEPLSHVPSAARQQIAPSLLKRLRSLPLDGMIYEDVLVILRAASFPRIMSLSGETVFNPIWTDALRDTEHRLAASFAPDGTTPPRLMPLDIFLVKAEDQSGRPSLLTYFSGKPTSGWQAFLFPFRQRELGEDEKIRLDLNAKDLAHFLGMTPDGVSMTSLGQRYAVSVKPDFGYGDLVVYIFTFCSVKLTSPPDWLSHRDAQSQLEYSTRRFHWFHPEDLEKDTQIMRVNADLIRAVHYLFATTLPAVPASVSPGFLKA